MDPSPRFAPGGPGSPARWTSSAKTAIGTASIDHACVRDIGLIVSDGGELFSEEKRDTDSRI